MTTTRTDLTDATLDTLDALEVSVIGETGDMRQLGNAAEGPWGWYSIEAIEAAADVAEEHEGEERDRLNVFAAALPAPAVLTLGSGEVRVCVDGEEIPPYEGAVAYVRNAAGEHGIRYAGNHTDWLGTAGKAFGDDEITLHPSEEPATLDALLDALRAGLIGERDYDEWTSLPTYGGEEPTDTVGVWSWDATRLIVGEGRDLRIISREGES